MTKLLVSIQSLDDVSKDQISLADILSMSYDLGASNNSIIASSDNKTEIFIEMTCEQLSRQDVNQHLLKQVGNISIQLTDVRLLEDLQNLQKYTSALNLFASISFQQAMNTTLLNLITSIGFKGIELRPQNESVHFLKETDIATIGQLVTKIKECYLKVGLSGGLEAPDIPRLLPFAPNWLGFNGSDLFISKDNANLIRALIPHEETRIDLSQVPNLGTDRLLVSDFIVLMEIGAYGHEVGRQQRVRFNIAADVTRISNNPEDMSHIFSYDLIMDGIRRLASFGHIELVETLAERIAGFLLAYPRVERVIVRVEKLDLGPGAVGVEIMRHK